MKGKRIYTDSLEPGDYGFIQYSEKLGGAWYGIPPNKPNLFGSFRFHEVVEHDDGTITVSPSILIENGSESWHGYLERGIWREI